MKNNAAEHQRGGLSRFWTETTEYNALVCSIAFFLIFTAFGTVQNWATSQGNDGTISLTILYAVLTVSNVVVPVLLEHMSPKVAMFLGSATYALYVAANIHVIDPVLYAAAALEGFGAAVLWVGQGSFITKCAYEYADKYNLDRKAQLGYYNGLFWAWMVGNQFVGNLIAALLKFFKVSNTVVYIVLTSVNVLGVLTFLFIKPFESDLNDGYIENNRLSAHSHSHSREINEGLIQQQQQNLNEDDLTATKDDRDKNNKKQSKTTLSDINTVNFLDNTIVEKSDKMDIMSAIRLWSDPKLWLLILFTLYSGISQAFEYGSFPALIDDDAKKFFAMSIFGLFDAVCSLIFGYASDKIGRLPVLTVSFIAHGAVFITLYLYTIPQKSGDDKYYDFFILAAVLGIGDAGFNTQLYALYASLLGEKAATFANLKFWQSVSMTWGFLWQSNWLTPYISHKDVYISCFALMCSAALPLYLSKTVRDVSRPKSHGLSF